MEYFCLYRHYMAFSLCSTKSFMLLLLISAIPFAYIISLERTKFATHVYQYHSSGFMRECAKWDQSHRRFLVSFLGGGIGQISVPRDYLPQTVLNEVMVVKDVDLAGNASLGIVLDHPRNRLLVVVSDLFWNKYSALAAYDLSTWKRSFLTQLSGPSKFIHRCFSCYRYINLSRMIDCRQLLKVKMNRDYGSCYG